MKGKQGNLQNMMMGIIGIIILALALIFLFKTVMGGFSIIIVGVVVLGIISFLGWFVLEYIH
ncbi:hypothetical protein KY348_01575 [Candidatus Woesearchaeota archaeon]|nr:hypothetical protein [Candidatus Woesearchaeota archaeon]